MTRKCTLEDVPWLLEMGRKHYARYFKNMDENAMVEWVKGLITNPDVLFLRKKNAAVLSCFGRSIYDNKLRGEIKMLAGSAIQVARIMIFMKKLGVDWEFKSSTEQNLGKLAKIVGAKQGFPVYYLESDTSQEKIAA